MKFAFPPRATEDLHGLAKTEGNELVYLRELQKGETAGTYLEGYGAAATDNDIRVENRNTGAGVRQTGDHPIARMYFWSIRTTICPEAYISLAIEPGQETKWQINYESRHSARFRRAPIGVRAALEIATRRNRFRQVR